MIARLFALLRDRPRTALAVYWSLAFVVTHVPPLLPRDDDDGPEPLIGADKVVHLIGFAALAFLLANVLGRRFGRGTATLMTLAIGAIYGVFDEVTQPMFGRTADPFDWVADLIGLAIGLALYRLARRRGL